jgi:putative transposase
MNYQQGQKSVSYFDQRDALPEVKRDPELSWLKEVPSQSLQMALRHLDNAFKNFFWGYRKISSAQEERGS